MPDTGSNMFSTNSLGSGSPLMSTGSSSAAASGNTATAPTTSTMFPSLNAASGQSTKSVLFGNISSQPSAPSFGFNTSGNATSAPAPGSLFKTAFPPTNAGGSTSSGLNFGQTTSSSGATDDKPSTAGAGIFSNASQPKGSLFPTAGNADDNAATSAPATSVTPAPTKTLNFFTTTPAGPPPTSITGQSPGLFASLNKSSSQPTFSLAGAKPAEQQQLPPSSQPSSSIFNIKPSDQQPTGNAITQPPSKLFNTTPQATSSPFAVGQPRGTSQKTLSLFGAKPAEQAGATSQPALSIFASKPVSGNSLGSSAAGISSFSSTQPTTSSAPFATGIGGAGTTAPLTGNTPAVTTAGGKANMFGSFGGVGTSTSTSGTLPAATTAGGGGDMFGSLSGAGPSVSTIGTKPAVTTAGGGLSGILGGAGASTSTTESTTATSAGTAMAGGLGATGKTTSAQPNATTATAAPTFGAATAGAASTAVPALGASTAGPPAQHSRLKNKTMDEIITRWASDLSKHQKEFQLQATKVAAWDRLLVDNGAKIQVLYNSAFEAERANAEIERQISTVESQQEELSAWLDRYEGEVDDMHARQVGPGELLSGPDQERERTYKLAEILTERLDDMGKDLTKMIDGMNEASATLNKGSKADDPLSHIVQVLNSHLRQLQWIDQNTKTLQEKIDAAGRPGQSIGSNGRGGIESETTDTFYRSYMSRR